MAELDPVEHAQASVSRLSNLILTVIVLGFLIGIVSSIVVTLLQQCTVLLMIVGLIAVVLIVLMVLWFTGTELVRRSLVQTLATAIVFEPATNRIIVPTRLRMSPRDLFPPFPVLSVQTHLRMKKHKDLIVSDNIWNQEVVFTLLTAFADRLELADHFAPANAVVNRGPFLNYRQIKFRQTVAWKFEDCTPSLIDTGVVRRVFPLLVFNLPKGISLKVHLSGRVQTVELSSLGIALTLSAAGGQGAPVNLSSWKRQFAGGQTGYQIMGMLFSASLSFGGRSMFRAGKSSKPSEWSFNDTLHWFHNVYEWFHVYLDWIDSDEEIPVEERFDLVSEFPPHYKFSNGAIPPGNGEIIFQMEE